MATILERYIAQHPGSADRYRQAVEIFPGGVTHDNRYAEPFPLYITHGQGPRKWDVDGHEYIDYVSGHGALILGHSHPAVADAVAEQMRRGTHLGACTDEELRWARAIMHLMPSVERVRFHSSGTEATLMAMRLARAYTGRNKIIKLQDHFHGWHDYAMAGSDRPAPGIPPGILGQHGDRACGRPRRRSGCDAARLRHRRNHLGTNRCALRSTALPRCQLTCPACASSVTSMTWC